MHTLQDEFKLQQRHENAIRYQAEKLLIELCERLGEQKYFDWVDLNLFDGEDWEDVKEKAVIELNRINGGTFTCLGCFQKLPMSAKGFNRCRRCEVGWTDDPRHYKTNGVY